MFNRNKLFIPVQSDRIRRYDLAAPAAPAALADQVVGLDIEVISMAMFSNGDLCLLDQGGHLVRRTQAGVTVWDVDARASTEVPYQVAVDSLDQIWVGMTEGEVARFDSAGGLLNRIDDSNNPVVQAADSDQIATYNPESGRFVMIDKVSGTVAADFTLADLSDLHEPCAVVQLGMIGDKVYVPARRKLSAVENPGLYEILEVTTEGNLLSVLSFTWPRTLTGTLCDATGKVWAMDEFGAVIGFLSDLSLAAIYVLESEGRLWAMALSTDAAVLYVVSDGIFGVARLHTVNPAIGVPTHQDFVGTEIHGGDLTGYQLATVIAEPDVAGLAPTIDAALITGLVLPGGGGSTLITGKPGAALAATSVTCSVGTAPVNPDGSFAIAGASMAPGNVTLTFTGPGGTTPQVVAVAAHAETATSAAFFGTKFGTDGGYLQVKIADGSGPVTTGTHYVRIRDLASGKYWNGSAFVASNGLFLPLAHQAYGLWSYLFVPGVEGNYAAFFSENNVYAFDAVQVTKEKQESTDTLSKVNEMQAPGAALLAPASLFPNEATVGGRILGRLDRLGFLTSILAFKAKIVFPKAIEGIGAVVSRTQIKKLDTPLILVTIVDKVTGDPADTTGHTIRLKAALQPGSPTIFDRELEAIDAAHGQYQVRLTAIDTGAAGSFLAELKDISPSGVVLTSQTFDLVITQGL